MSKLTYVCTLIKEFISGRSSVSRDNLEVSTSMFSGAMINYCLTLYLFGVSPAFGLKTTLIFMAASYARSYILRRIFRKFDKKG